MGWYKPRYVEYSCEEIGYPQFKFKLLDPISMTPKDLERAFQESQEENLAILGKVVREHNFTHPETDEPLPQFHEDPKAAEELPIIFLRFILEKFQELASPERKIVPLRS